MRVALRLVMTLGLFVIAWFAISIVARWFFGSSNFLSWVLATMVAAAVYVALVMFDRRQAGAR